MAVSRQVRAKSEGLGVEGDRDKALEILSQLSEDLMSLSPTEFIERLPDKVCELLGVPICIIWQKVREQPKFKIIAASQQVDDKYKQSELDLNHPGVKYIFQKNDILSLSDVSKSKFRLEDIEELKRKGWVSFLGTPLIIDGNAVGILYVFTKNTRHFTNWEKHLFRNLANYTNLALSKIEFIQEKYDIAEDRQKLQKLTDIMVKMSQASNADELWTSLMEGASELTDSHYIAIHLLDHLNGALKIVKTNKTDENESSQKPPLRFGQGIISKALKDEKTIRVADIQHPDWQKIYVEHWQDTRSEMAILLLINGVPIRVRRDVKLGAGSKRIGVLNMESTNVNAFSDTDQKRLELLARYAAVIFDRLKADKKLRDLREIERKITEAKDTDQIIETIIKGIADVLEFNWVNISLINSVRTHIKSEYVAGLTEDLANYFKEESIHPLASNDINADIVRTRQIEVPEVKDPRFDLCIFKKYGHEEMIRVFIPMIEPSSSLVIGTVEAGYSRKYREYIYEQDVQILKSFVDYAVYALERKKARLIDKFIHEFKSPIVGIRNNADYLQRKMNQLSQDYIDIKFEDIITNCGILFYHLGELEYILGAPSSQKLNFSRTVVFRDIIIKTIYELQPVFRERKFSIANITYNKSDSSRIIAYTDKIKLNQVVYNLLINSIKYAESDPNKFKMVLEVDEDPKNFIIKFKDWGMGVKLEYGKKIFEEGFRSPEAIAKDVAGSGLGLTISQTIMRQLGGDLKLVNNANPTEFHLVIPKNPDARFCY